ncbi:MAG: RidA family protein [Myxococcota bacterium]
MAQKQIIAEGPFRRIIADGVRVGNTIHLSGAVSVDADGNALHEGDVVAQLRQAYANIADVLTKFGSTMDDIVYETVFVTDMDGILGDEEITKSFFGARAEAYGGKPEVSQSLIGISKLIMPELLIEIQVVAQVS